jgi:hypothetical protein
VGGEGLATLGTINYGSVYGQSLKGCKHLVLPFTAVANTNTYTTGFSECVAVAWEPTAATDIVAVTETGGTVTFATAGATSLNGNLHLWVKQY